MQVAQRMSPRDISELFENGDAPAINENFRKWRDHVEYSIRNRTQIPLTNKHYQKSPDVELLVKAKSHIECHQRAPQKTWVTLTHPFYAFLSHRRNLDNPNLRQDAQKYLSNLARLIAEIDHKKASLVVLETLHHYAAFTATLLETGLVDRVVLTQNDFGQVLDMSELEPFGSIRYFCGGAYNSKCFIGSLKSIASIVKRPAQISVITGLVLNSPVWTDYGLLPRKASIEIPCVMKGKSSFVTLYHVLRQYGL